MEEEDDDLNSFDGRWVNEHGAVMAIILGNFIFWADGPPMQFEVCGEDGLRVEPTRAKHRVRGVWGN